ncbi:hypothetical protein GCM10028818_59980 [Spirosoma horti]
MKAKAHYDDYLGTSAADTSDGRVLDMYFEEKGGDLTRYKPIGTHFFLAHSNALKVSFLCIDSTVKSEEPYIVELTIKGVITYEEYFKWFRGLDVMFTKREYKELEISEILGIEN